MSMSMACMAYVTKKNKNFMFSVSFRTTLLPVSILARRCFHSELGTALATTQFNIIKAKLCLNHLTGTVECNKWRSE